MQQNKIHNSRHPIKSCLACKAGNKYDPWIKRGAQILVRWYKKYKNGTYTD